MAMVANGGICHQEALYLAVAHRHMTLHSISSLLFQSHDILLLALQDLYIASFFYSMSMLTGIKSLLARGIRYARSARMTPLLSHTQLFNRAHLLIYKF